MHPPPPSSIHLHPAHFNLHPAPSTSTQLSATPSTIFEPKFARNWAISPNLGQKIKIYLFWLITGIHCLLDVLIPNPDLDFWNCNPKIHFWANLSPKIQSCSFCLKIGAHSISSMQIPDPDSDFWNSDPFLGKYWSKKSNLFMFRENWHACHLDDADSYSNISFLNCQP